MGNANKLAEDLKQKINHVENLMETVEHNQEKRTLQLTTENKMMTERFNILLLDCQGAVRKADSVEVEHCKLMNIIELAN
jgi:uncharacterized protein YoxC